METEIINKKSIITIAGAFLARVIGSGFATGQEILQFFSSYGYYSFGIIGINFIGFLVLGYFFMKIGFENKEVPEFNHFKYLCGNKIGIFYTSLITFTLILLMPVLVAGAGATLYEYYGLNRYIGSAIMTILILVAYLVGFLKMVKLISFISPIVIAFSITVGAITVITDFHYFNDIPTYFIVLEPYNSAPSWFLSSLLYLGLNFFPASIYFNQLGKTANSKKELKYGLVLGIVLLMIAITIMSTAILLNGNQTVGLEVPMLYLANKISYVLGGFFSIVLILGIFSSSSTMMWSVCSRFHIRDKKKNTILAIGISVTTLIISMFPFGKLVGIFYPIIGYIGLVFFVNILYRRIEIFK